MNDPEKLDLCRRAIRHVLAQVQDRAEFRYVLGPGTESFRRLVTAFAALDGADTADTERLILLGCRERDQIVRVVRLHDFAPRLQREGLTDDTRRTVLRECGFDGDEIDEALGGAS